MCRTAFPKDLSVPAARRNARLIDRTLPALLLVHGSRRVCPRSARRRHETIGVIAAPELSIVVCTYQRPRNLAACLDSIARQEGVGGRFELIVADDGSRDETSRVVEDFLQRVRFPVTFTTVEHQGFQPARCRNAGVRASSGAYLLFVDGDCVLPPDHARVHLERRRAGVVQGGDSYRLTAEQSDRAARGCGAEELERMAPFRERWRVMRNDWDARLNWLLRNPRKPKLFAGDIGIWRRDLESVNGFDQRFRGWGGEDDDLRTRLLTAGLRIRSVRHLTRSFHLWHPPDATVPGRWTEGPNASLVQRRFRLTRCVDGLVKRGMEDLSIRIRNGSRYASEVAEAFPYLTGPAAGERADIECLFLPGVDGFTRRADCRVLVLTDRVARPPLDQADVLVTDFEDVRFDAGPRFRLAELHRILEVFL